MDLTPKQLHILRHSLGLDDHGKPYFRASESYRNHYISDPDDDLTALCEAGLMANYGSSAGTGGMNCYRVTDAGKKLVEQSAPPPEKLSRSKMRYRQWLDQDCGMRFGQWLKHFACRKAS